MNEWPVENSKPVSEEQALLPASGELKKKEKLPIPAHEEEEKLPAGWAAMEEITKGDWKRLMGCGG